MTTTQQINYRTIDSPFGLLLLAGRNNILQRIGFPTGKGAVQIQTHWQKDSRGFEEAARQLSEYFAGDRQSFDLALQPHGTDFQLQVLDALQQIPYGQTTTYQAIANAIGRPNAVRAVGAANGRNPLPIVIPCHRVIGTDGSLTGFGGGLPTKQFLLTLESQDFQLSSPVLEY